MNEFKRMILRTQIEDYVPPIGTCKKITVTISPIDSEDSTDGTVSLYYTNCSGNSAVQVFPDAGTYNSLCADVGTAFALSYVKDGVTMNAGNSGAVIEAANCGE